MPARATDVIARKVARRNLGVFMGAFLKGCELLCEKKLLWQDLFELAVSSGRVARSKNRRWD
jgi:hypothetical protein